MATESTTAEDPQASSDEKSESSLLKNAEEVQTQMMELSRSMIRFSWAMAMFGAQQAANVATLSGIGKSSPKAAEAFDAVANSIEEQFGGIFRGAYKTGNAFTKGAMDTMLGQSSDSEDSDETEETEESK